jgi:cytochrome c oxidase subunit 3
MSAEAVHHPGQPAGFGQFGSIDRVMVGLITFLASEVMLFGAFFTAFFYIRYSTYAHQFPPLPYDIPKRLTGINTFILVSSSFTMHWALVSIKRENRLGLILGLFLTLGLGLTFLGIQIYEYHDIGFTPESGAFASTFFCLTGLHGCHVFIGALLLAIAFVRSLRGHYSAEHHMGVELTGIYWHFVDFVWVILYAIVYLIAPTHY